MTADAELTVGAVRLTDAIDPILAGLETKVSDAVAALILTTPLLSATNVLPTPTEHWSRSCDVS